MKTRLTLSVSILLCILLSASAQTLSVTGKVQTPAGEPLDFVNIVLTTAKDSTFIAGTVTNGSGEFTLSVGREYPQPWMLTASYLGFESKTLPVTDRQVGTIIMDSKDEMLDEVMITAASKPYTQKGTSLIANVSSTLLKDAGTAIDVLENVPYVKVAGTDVSVFGKGTPLIYINNRKVQSSSELEQLNSAQIKSIEVITTPGSQYDATVGAVIKITTIRSNNQEFAGSFLGRAEKGHEWNEAGSMNLTYHSNKLNLYGDFSARNTQRREDQKLMGQIHGEKEYQHTDASRLRQKSRPFSSGVGMDYAFNEKHSAGGKFSYSWNGKSNFRVNTLLNRSEDGVILETLRNNGFYDFGGHNGYLNSYYSGEMGKLAINLNVDYAYGKSSIDSDFENLYEDREKEYIKSKSQSDFKLIAGKLDFSFPLALGTAMFGSEYAYTDNDSRYANDSQELQEDLPSTVTNNRQDLLALFASYRKEIGNFSFNAGLRFEHVKFDYSLNNVLQKEQSKKYNDLFPVVSLFYAIPDKSINMSLSYRKTISRPSYYQLRGDIQYNSPYGYEGGNPALLSAFINDVSYMFSYRTFTLMAGYKYIEDDAAFITEQFGDKPITLSTNININKSEKVYVSSVWSPTFFKIWNPEVEVGFNKQFLSMEYEGKSVSYNKPGISCSLYNTVKLPKEFALILYAGYESASESGFAYSYSSSFVSFSAQKRFLDNRLSVRVGASDIFRKNKERWDMNYKNVHTEKRNEGDSRRAYIRVSYNLNRVKKYSGKGAATEEKNRLGIY